MGLFDRWFGGDRGRDTRLNVESGLHISEAQANALQSELDSIAYGFQEATGFSSQLLDLKLEDIGWQQLGGMGGGFNVVQPFTRRDVVQRARKFAIFDPLAGQSLAIWRNFTIGTGITVDVDEDAQAQAALANFWTATRNRSAFSTAALRRNSDILHTDGELIFVVFTGSLFGGTTVRHLNSLEISTIVKAKEDQETAVGYVREWMPKAGGKLQKRFYWDMFWPEEKRREAKTLIPNGVEIWKDAVVHFTTINTAGDRGNSLLTSSMDWTKAHRKFMEARHAIQLALARFATRHKIKGGAKAVQNTAAFHRSALANSGSDGETNPAQAPGSVWVENQSSDYQAMKQETGAQAAQVDGDMLLQMQGVGVGLFPHYYGSGNSAGNLSVSTNMELPMLKQFQAGQGLIGDTYTDLIVFDQGQQGVPEDQQGATIEFPPIVVRDVPALMKAAADAVLVAPRLGGTREMEMHVLQTLNFQNPAEILDRLDDAEPEGDTPGDKAEDDDAARAIRTLRRASQRIRGEVA